MVSLREERKLWKKGFKRVVGLDEVGRGALAGPVVAAAVIIKIPNPKSQFPKLRDSKKLSQKQREKIYKLITKNSMIEWGIGKVSEKMIDKINIFKATKLAMKRAVNNLAMKRAINNLEKTFPTKFYISMRSHPNIEKNGIDFLILDGNLKIDLPIPQKPIVKADEKVFSSALASIIAKVARDRIMKRYHQKYPQYGFARHKGYPTKFHRKMIKKYGPCKIHRKSFKLL